MRISFGKVVGFIRVYDRTIYLVLFGPEKYDTIYNTIRYLICQKRGVTYVISHNYALHVCNGYHEVLTMYLNDIVILNINGVDYRRITKREAVNLLANIDLSEKSKTL